MLNLWAIDLQGNEINWEVELCSGMSKTMYTKQDKFETILIRIDQLITTLIFIHSNSNTMVLQYEGFESCGADSKLPTKFEWLTSSMCLNHCMGSISLTPDV